MNFPHTKHTIPLRETLPSSLVRSILNGVGVNIELVPGCPFLTEHKWSKPYLAATIVLPVNIDVVNSCDASNIKVGKYFNGQYQDPFGHIYNENSSCIFLNDVPPEHIEKLASEIVQAHSTSGCLLENYFHRDVFLYHIH